MGADTVVKFVGVVTIVDWLTMPAGDERCTTATTAAEATCAPQNRAHRNSNRLWKSSLMAST